MYELNKKLNWISLKYFTKRNNDKTFIYLVGYVHVVLHTHKYIIRVLDKKLNNQNYLGGVQASLTKEYDDVPPYAKKPAFPDIFSPMQSFSSNKKKLLMLPPFGIQKNHTGLVMGNFNFQSLLVLKLLQQIFFSSCSCVLQCAQ